MTAGDRDARIECQQPRAGHAERVHLLPGRGRRRLERCCRAAPNRPRRSCPYHRYERGAVGRGEDVRAGARGVGGDQTKAPREPHEVDLTDGWGLAWKPRKAANAAADDDNAP